MAGVTKFEDLIAWQKARRLACMVYDATEHPPFASDHGLKGQIQRAAVSVMSNIAEGFEREGANEFRRFLSIAKASCAEVRSLLYVALDVEYLPREAFEEVMALADEVARLVIALRNSVGRSEHR